MRLWRWALVLSVIILYGLMPIGDINIIFEDDKDFILIQNQQCTCCPNGRVIKGEIKIPSKLKAQYPFLIDNSPEISLVNFYPFDNITENYSWVINTTFKVKGEIISLDSVSCGKFQKTEISPIFRVEKWTTLSYLPILVNFDIFSLVAYFLVVLIWLYLIVKFIYVIHIRKKL